MPINWNLFTPVDTGAMWRQGWERGQAKGKERRLSSALAAFGANPSDPQAQSALASLSPEFAMKLGANRWELQQKEAERARLATMFGGGGDPAQAAEQAYRAGYPEIGAKFESIATIQQKRADVKGKGMAQYAYAAKKLPYEQRKAFLQSQAANLATSGWTPEEIDAIDPTDTELGGRINQALSVEEQQSRDRVTWHTRLDGSTFATDYWGNIVGKDGNIDRPVAPAPGGAAPAPAVDPLAPGPSASTPSGSPLDKPHAQAPATKYTAAAKPGETMEAYIRRRAEEAKAEGQDAIEVNRMRDEMLADIGVTP